MASQCRARARNTLYEKIDGDNVDDDDGDDEDDDVKVYLRGVVGVR